MLKSLIGHWKAHKRKPPLLPEDGIILHPEDPPRINPIFVDSDESLTSSHRGPDSIELDVEQNITLDSQKNIQLDLVDISIPVKAEADDPKSDVEENPDDVINQIDIAIDSSLSNEEKLESLERELQEANEQSNEEPTNVISEVKDKEVITALEKEPDILLNETNLPISSEIQTKSESSRIEPILTDNQRKEEESDMTPRTEDSVIPSTSRGTKSEENRQSKEMELPTPNLVAEQKMVKNIKTRAIDELIKKFQGQNSGNDPAVQTIPSFLHSPNRKSILKTKAFEQSNDTENTPSVNGQQKESLSKIFNFPPPPPIEPLLNSKPFRKDVQKDIKTPISKSPSNASRSATPVEGKTRSDSSLTRNKTVSSSISKPLNKTGESQANKEIKVDSSLNNVPINEPQKIIKTEQSNARRVQEPITKTEQHQKETALSSDSKAEYSIIEADETIVKTPIESNLQSKPSTSFPTKQTSSENSVGSKQNPEKQTLIPNKSSLFNSSRSPKLTNTKVVHDSETPVTKLSNSTIAPDVSIPVTKQTNAKPVPDVATSTKEADSPKSNAEDSGITRGDQVSSEESPDVPLPPDDAHQHNEVPPTPAKRNLKDRRSLKHRQKGCRHCRKSHDDATPLNIGQYDAYYDILTGARKSPRTKDSGSWGSDLSFEEKELIRRLRSRRDTIRSNATSTKSRQSNYQDVNFHRHNPLRRSMSENSILNEPSMCSCDQCYMILVKDYAYSRSSLRGMAPNKVVCTCRTPHADVLGRRVKFRSDPIPEGSTSASTPTIPEEPSSEKEDDKSTTSQANGVKNGKTKDKKDKKTKSKKDTYHLVTPWELEAWETAMKRQVLLKRRKRARYMALMALAMVIFVGLVVTVLMVYLRRRSL